MASMDVVNCSERNFTNKTCFKFSRYEFTSVFWTVIGVATLAASVCLLAILIIVFVKAYKKYVHRLSLCLFISALARAISNVLECAPVENLCGYVVVRNEKICSYSSGISGRILTMDAATLYVLVNSLRVHTSSIQTQVQFQKV